MKIFKKSLLILLFSVIGCMFAFSQDKGLKVPPENIVISARPDGTGYDLYVKKTERINSILLTESIKDYSGNNDSYAYRATEYNPINGDEIRYLNDLRLDSEYSKYSLVDSTPEKTPFFDEAFHIYIPPKLVFGYEWSRNGQVEIGNRTFINIRAFERPYADHSGAFADSPYYVNLVIVEKVKKEEPKKEDPVEEVLVKEEADKKDEVVTEELVKKEETPVEEEKSEVPSAEYIANNYNVTASQELGAISEEIVYNKGPSSLIGDIKKLLDKHRNKDNLDIVFAIDGTASMEDDLYILKHNLIPELKEKYGSTQANFGLLYYRDYDDYVSSSYKNLPVHIFELGRDLDTFLVNLNSITAYGGGDTPEAVYEAIYAAADGFAWREGSERRIILIGDAEPHPEPRGTGKYSKEYVMSVAAEKGIKVSTILLP